MRNDIRHGVFSGNQKQKGKVMDEKQMMEKMQRDQQEKIELIDALHAAIDSPKGVVPDCAEKYYNQHHPLFDKYSNSIN